jgi:Zn-dependent peptidase ImmA (M78 family)
MNLSRMDLADETRPKEIAALLLSNIREQCGGVVPIPVPVRDIALQLEIRAIETVAVKSIDGMLLVGDGDDEGSAIIFVNESQSGQRIRFTIGHELGHWLIPSHTLDQKNFSCSNQKMQSMDVYKQTTPLEKIEVEANLFSSELLLPEKEFRVDLRTSPEPCLSNVIKLSNIYDVSKHATARRFVMLNDHPCAIIQSHDRIISHIYSNKDFPFMAVKNTNPLPPRSMSAQDSDLSDRYSEMLPSDWKNWLKNKPVENAELNEQVLFQQNGYRMTLLFLDTKNCLDEDELEDQKLELREMSFLKGR